MAEKFAKKFGNGSHKLNIGKSFEKKGGNSVFHSIRYDFTPLSVDEEKMGQLEVEANHSVSVTLPHIDGHGATQYKGNAKPAATKDCILIIDHETGELTLERLSNQIMLKKTRPEKAEKKEAAAAAAAANPYQVRSEPRPGRTEKESPGNPYEVRPAPEKPRTSGSSGRPTTPQARAKKQSPSISEHSTISPLSSNRNSPVRPCSSASAAPSHLSQPAVDSLGRVLSETSDSGSGSSSDSESDSEDTTELQGEGGCKLAAAMAAVDSPTPPLNPASTFSMPGELSDLFLPGGAPQQLPNKARSKPDSRGKPGKTEKGGKTSPEPSGAGCMPIFADLGDDLQLTDESD